MARPHRLSAALRLVAPDVPYLELAAGPPPDGWMTVEEASRFAGTWLDQLTARRAAGRRDIAAAFLASWLTRPIVVPAVLVHLHGGRLPLAPSSVALRRHHDGWFDGAAFGGAGADGIAPGVVATVEPIFDAVRTAAPSCARLGMWGRLADDVGAAVAGAIVRRELDAQPTWAGYEAVLDQLPVRVRPHLGPDRTFQRGTCCLAYLLAPAPRGTDAYCSTCPLVRRGTAGAASGSRRRRLG